MEPVNNSGNDQQSLVDESRFNTESKDQLKAAQMQPGTEVVFRFQIADAEDCARDVNAVVTKAQPLEGNPSLWRINLEVLGKGRPIHLDPLMLADGTIIHEDDGSPYGYFLPAATA